MTKIVHQSKLEAFADRKHFVTQILKIVLGRLENIVGKGENSSYQHFLHFILKGYFLRVIVGTLQATVFIQALSIFKCELPLVR